jgi:hypothetical protein
VVVVVAAIVIVVVVVVFIFERWNLDTEVHLLLPRVYEYDEANSDALVRKQTIPTE